jgi:hypothetical protein
MFKPWSAGRFVPRLRTSFENAKVRFAGPAGNPRRFYGPFENIDLFACPVFLN